MPASVDLPPSLNHLAYFVVRYHRDVGTYELVEPQKTNTYSIGDAFKTRAYFKRIGLEHLGGRAMDAALAFGASQAVLSTNLAFGLDLCKLDFDAGVTKQVDKYDFEDEDDERIFISGLETIPR